MLEDDIRMIGGFRIEGALKSSGMQGRVYKAVCETDDLSWCGRGTVVALKTMQVGSDAEAAWEKLRVQTESLARLDHPNVVKYLGCFTRKKQAHKSVFHRLTLLSGALHNARK
jgi:serine/threonine protein kinase